MSLQGSGHHPPGRRTRILLNSLGVSSNPLSHQAQSTGPLELGSSGGNNNDYDLSRGQIVDCCSGTLGSLLQGSDNKKYLLSNNHVLARSDQANVGDPIIQPGLIDNNCTPMGEGAGANPVGTLTGWLPLNSNSDERRRSPRRSEAECDRSSREHSGDGSKAT